MHPGPIIIGGPDRCGKTLMRALLASHPNIAIPDVGSNMWTYFYRQYGDLARPENFERCLLAMLRYKHVRFLKPDANRLRQEFQQGERTYGRLFALFHEHYAERMGKPRWGDQTGLVERYADDVFAAYPTAKMIHMLRDPRDRYEASLALWPDGRGRAGGATARWLYSVGLARRNLNRYPDRYRIVRYETLVRQPEATLRSVCEFLGEDYIPAMLMLDGAPCFRDQADRTSGDVIEGTALSTAYIGRFKSKVPKREVAFIQACAAQAMVAHGYDLVPNSFSVRDWPLFYFVDFPANTARLITWRTIEAVQHNFPATLGRKPATKMIVGKGAK